MCGFGAMEEPQGLQVSSSQVGAVLPYRRQAAAAGQHPYHGQGQDRKQAVTHAPPITRSVMLLRTEPGPARQGGCGGRRHRSVTSLVTGLSRCLHRHRAGHAVPAPTHQTR